MSHDKRFEYASICPSFSRAASIVTPAGTFHEGSSLVRARSDQDIEVRCPAKRRYCEVNVSAENEKLHLRLHWKKKRNPEKEEQTEHNARLNCNIWKLSCADWELCSKIVSNRV